MKPEVVCLSGSMKYYDRMLMEELILTQQRKIVLKPCKDDPARMTRAIQEELLKLQKERIKMSDYLYVINQDGYIGRDTRKEIFYALYNEKKVRYLNTPMKPYIVTLCGSRKFLETFAKLNTLLSLGGYIVNLPATVMMGDNLLESLTEEEHLSLDSLHRVKMLKSHEVIIVNPDGYVGHDTQEEIDYAAAHNLNVTYLEDVKKNEEDNDNAEEN